MIFSQIKIILWAGKSWPLWKVHHGSKVHIHWISGLDHFSWHHPTIIACEVRFCANLINIMGKIQTGWFQITLLACPLHSLSPPFKWTILSHKAGKLKTAQICLFLLLQMLLFWFLSVLSVCAGIDSELLLNLFSDAVSAENDKNNRLQGVILWNAT